MIALCIFCDSKKKVDFEMLMACIHYVLSLFCVRESAIYIEQLFHVKYDSLSYLCQLRPTKNYAL